MLVHGAAGGVGTAALQVAKGLGARTIARRLQRREGARRARGRRRRGRPLRRAVEGRGQGLSGGGVDLVLDPVGGDRFTDWLRSLREERPVVVVGFTGGSIPEVKVNRLLLNNTEVVGAGWGAYVIGKPDAQPRDRRGARRADRLRPRAPIVGAALPLERAADALEAHRRPRRAGQGRARRARRGPKPRRALAASSARRAQSRAGRRRPSAAAVAARQQQRRDDGEHDHAERPPERVAERVGEAGAICRARAGGDRCAAPRPPAARRQAAVELVRQHDRQQRGADRAADALDDVQRRRGARRPAGGAASGRRPTSPASSSRPCPGRARTATPPRSQ